MSGSAVPATGAASQALRARTRRPGAKENAAGRGAASPGLAAGAAGAKGPIDLLDQIVHAREFPASAALVCGTIYPENMLGIPPIPKEHRPCPRISCIRGVGMWHYIP